MCCRLCFVFRWVNVTAPDVLQNVSIDIKQFQLNCALCLIHKINIQTLFFLDDSYFQTVLCSRFFPCQLVDRQRCFAVTCWLHLHSIRISRAWKEVADVSNERGRRLGHFVACIAKVVQWSNVPSCPAGTSLL